MKITQFPFSGIILGLILSFLFGILSLTGIFYLLGKQIGYFFMWFYYILPSIILLNHCFSENCMGYSILLSVIWIVITGVGIGILIQILFNKQKLK